MTMSHAVKHSPTRTMQASALVHLDSFTRGDHLVLSKAPNAPLYIGRVYLANVLIGRATEFGTVIGDVVKAMPDDGVVQVTELCVPDYGAQQQALAGKTHGGPELRGLVQSQAGVYAQALRIGWRADLPALNRRQVVISVSAPVPRVTQQVLDEARLAHAALLASLRASGFADVRPLDTPQLAGLYRQFGNIFEPFAPVELDDLVELKYQLFAPDLELDFRDRSIGVIRGQGLAPADIYCAGVTVKAFPRRVSHGLMNLVTGAPFNQGTVADGGGPRIATPFAMTTIIRVANQRREGTRIEQAIRSRVQGNPITLRLGTENPEDKLADLQTLRTQCGNDADNNKYVYVSFTAFVYGRTAEQATTAQSLLCTAMAHLDFDARPIVGNALVRWAQTLPLNYSTAVAKALDGESVMSSQAAGALLPVYGDHAGNAQPAQTGRSGIPFLTRRGSAYWLDIFRTNTTAHGFISAGSGAGKTVFAQFMVENLLAEGAMVFVLDNGRGMKNLASAVGGEFNEFGGAAGITASLNPFTGLTDDEFDAQQETITALLMMMAYEGEAPAPGARIAMNEAGGSPS